jgi:hypothetical protein
MCLCVPVVILSVIRTWVPITLFFSVQRHCPLDIVGVAGKIHLRQAARINKIECPFRWQRVRQALTR